MNRFPATQKEQQKLVSSDGDEFIKHRERMIREQLQARDITDSRVLGAMLRVPRHEFVPIELIESAYDDNALPIKLGQTISQPYIVAIMTDLIDPQPGDRVLEVGTGSGYQAAVLAQLADDVYSIERLGGMLERARANLLGLKLSNLRLAHGDGNHGLEKAAPFNSIIVAAAAAQVPQALLRQLALGGRMILPVKKPGAGRDAQRLMLIERGARGYVERELDPVRFVPLELGKA